MATAVAASKQAAARRQQAKKTFDKKESFEILFYANICASYML